MTTKTDRLDSTIARLAPVRDADVHDGVDSAHAQALLAEILGSPRESVATRRRVPRALQVAVAALVAVGAAVAGALTLAGSHGTATASAAPVLRHAAAVARMQAPVRLAAGEFLYTKSVDAYLDTTVESGHVYAALVPHVRESWIGPTGGRVLQTSGAPTFLSDHDREAWIAAGRPSVFGANAVMDEPLDASHPLDLPANADALQARLKHDAAHFGERLNAEIFVLIGDSLRETNASPAQRAALYTVASRLPGVQLVGDVKDRAGRPGIAVSLPDDVNRTRDTLVFDPQTSVLLEEEEVTLAGNSFGYPAGTTIGHSTYIQTAVVSAIGTRPK